MLASFIGVTSGLLTQERESGVLTTEWDGIRNFGGARDVRGAVDADA
jgi:hypothetical protein